VCLGLASALASPLAALTSFLKDPAARRRLDHGRMKRLAAVLALLILAAVLVPLPRRISAEVLLEAPAAARVYVSVAGRLVETVPAGTAVRRGRILARLANPALQRDIEKTTGERNQAERHLEHLEASRANDPSASAQIPAAREALAALERRLAQQRQDEARLVLRAPADGIVIPAPLRSQREIRRPALPGWEGTPLDVINAGCWLEPGTLLCQVGDPAGVAPVVMIDQSEIDLVQPGQTVRLRVAEWPAAVLTGTIAEVAAINMQILPREAAAGGDVAARRDPAGVLRPVEATYTARVVLDRHSQQLLLRGRGRAKVTTAPAPLAQRLYRAVRQTFHFRL
jgi:putative peptide zinc metalloprotease protein